SAIMPTKGCEATHGGAARGSCPIRELGQALRGFDDESLREIHFDQPQLLQHLAALDVLRDGTDAHGVALLVDRFGFLRGGRPALWKFFATKSANFGSRSVSSERLTPFAGTAQPGFWARVSWIQLVRRLTTQRST